MPAATVRIKGLRETQRAFRATDVLAAKGLRAELKEAGNIVRDEGRRLFSGISGTSAAGFQTSVRLNGVVVRQRLRKTTGKRPDYGALQMRVALLPALARKQPEVEDRVELMLDRVKASQGF